MCVIRSTTLHHVSLAVGDTNGQPLHFLLPSVAQCAFVSGRAPPSACMSVFHEPQLLTIKVVWSGPRDVASVCTLQCQGLHMLVVYCT